MRITIYDKQYKLDVTQAEKLKVLIPITKRMVGQFYRKTDNDEIYILSCIDPMTMALICLNDGHRWTDSKHVNDSLDITDTEWKNITGNKTENFELVTPKFSTNRITLQS